MNPYNEDYYLRGEEKGISNYTDYRWLPELTIPMAETVVKFFDLDITQRETILDYGCARGYLVKALCSLGVEAYGCDISDWAINNSDPEMQCRVWNSGVHGIGKAHYDYVFCKDVLEHVQDLELPLLIRDIFAHTTKAALFIVPLARRDNKEYVYPNDELDITHVQRMTLKTWMKIISACTDDFIVMGSLKIPVLKKSIEQYPGSAGFIYCKRFP